MLKKLSAELGMTKTSVMLATFLLTSIAVSISYPAAAAAVTQNPVDPIDDQLRDQFNNVVNTPYDFCDAAAEHAHFMALINASGNMNRHQLEKPHPPDPDAIKHAEDKAVEDAKADGAPEDLPYVTDYENAGRRGDTTTQSALFKKMTPAAQAQAAQHDQNFPLTIKLLTPLADAGDVDAQLRLAGIYTFATTGFSAKYLPAPDAKLLEIFKKAGMRWPPVEPPENLPLAFKYFHSTAAKGNVYGQWGLGRAYACGLGTEKDLVRAYEWFSLGLAQRGVTVEITGASVPTKGHEKDYAVDRDFIIAQMKPEEIGQAKRLLTQCFERGYEKCD
jgi:hypothetical protein